MIVTVIPYLVAGGIGLDDNFCDRMGTVVGVES